MLEGLRCCPFILQNRCTPQSSASARVPAGTAPISTSYMKWMPNYIIGHLPGPLCCNPTETAKLVGCCTAACHKLQVVLLNNRCNCCTPGSASPCTWSNTQGPPQGALSEGCFEVNSAAVQWLLPRSGHSPSRLTVGIWLDSHTGASSRTPLPQPGRQPPND